MSSLSPKKEEPKLNINLNKNNDNNNDDNQEEPIKTEEQAKKYKSKF